MKYILLIISVTFSHNTWSQAKLCDNIKLRPSSLLGYSISDDKPEYYPLKGLQTFKYIGGEDKNLIVDLPLNDLIEFSASSYLDSIQGNLKYKTMDIHFGFLDYSTVTNDEFKQIFQLEANMYQEDTFDLFLHSLVTELDKEPCQRTLFTQYANYMADLFPLGGLDGSRKVFLEKNKEVILIETIHSEKHPDKYSQTRVFRINQSILGYIEVAGLRQPSHSSK